METGAVKSSWLDHKWVALASALVGVATTVSLILLGLVWTGRVPPDSALVAVSGDVVVLEGNYAHLTTDAGPLKITYACACNKGWRAGMRDSMRVEALVKRVNARRAEAHHVVVDGQVLVDINRARTHYQRKLRLAGSLVILCVPLLALRWAHRRHRRRAGTQASAEWLEVLLDTRQPWARRQEALELLVRSRDPELAWMLQELCSRNTESVEALELLGAALAQHLYAMDDEDIEEDDLIHLQAPARRAFEAARVRLGRKPESDSDGMRPQLDMP